ncbi:unknown [Bacteroides clarus CAG:160]|nr:unknown [Bacteroides clarus CAG:160]
MYKENMLQGIFSLLLLGKTDSNVFQVEERIDYTCTLVVIFQKFLRSSFKHVLIISS